MGYHTVLLAQSLYSLDYNSLITHLNELSKVSKARHYVNEKSSDEYVYELFKEDGIIILMRKTKIKRGSNVGPEDQVRYYCAIEIRLNPKVLIKKNEYVQVAKASDYDKIRRRFKEVLAPLQDRFESSVSLRTYRFNSINEYQIKRIDYCVNIRTPKHLIYMDLIRRAAIPPFFYLVKTRDVKSKRMKAYDNCFYIQCKSLGINCYNKEYQMQNCFSHYDHLEDANEIIRFEVQCFPQKTDNLKKKNGWRFKDMNEYIGEEIICEMIYTYYQKTVGFEDYYTLDKARDYIKASKYRNQTKLEMISVLELVNQKRSIPNALASYISEVADEEERVYMRNRFNGLLKKIKKSGVNPVTIPLNWGENYLPNLVYEIDKEFTQQEVIVIN